MTAIALMLVLVRPIQSSKWRLPIETPESCLAAYTVRMASCRAQFPDSTSIGRAVCEADAAGQYTACINGVR
jgi:hypothetical protein